MLAVSRRPERAAGPSPIARLLPLEPWLAGHSAEASEREQARLRVVLAVLGVFMAGVISWITGELPTPVAWAFALQLPIAFVWPWVLRLRPGASRGRRAFTIVLDNLVPSFVASFGGPWTLWIAVHFWVVVGYGLRFGPHYLVAAASVALAGMLFNAVFVPYWHDMPLVAATLVLALAFTTLNGLIVLRHLARANARLRRRAEEEVRLAWQDPLTGLPNRRHLFERLTHAIALSAREPRPLALLLFDVDGFKAVNDALGHDAGDEVLREIGCRVGARVRTADTFARLGGDEFVVFVETAKRIEDAEAVARAVLEEVSGIVHVHGRPIAIGASIGLAWYTEQDALPGTPDALIAAADRAMYDAKRAGKHRYRVARTSRAALYG